MKIASGTHDVLVVGGGMAALCAAIAARRKGASVLMMEAAPLYQRGGNARHSRNFRVMHEQPERYSPGRYKEEDFIRELERASKNQGDPRLIRLFVRKSGELPDWFCRQGLALQERDIPWSRKTAFFLGGGRAAINSLYRMAEKIGVQIAYDSPVENVLLNDSNRSIVLCCGGFQARPPAGIVNRGTPFATGDILFSLIRRGVQPVGQSEAGHLVAVDARSPEHDGGIVTRIDGMEHGIVVDRNGRRFQDETEFTEPTRYSAWGRRVANLPDKYAVLILDKEGLAKAPLFAVAPIRTNSVQELAAKLDLPQSRLVASILDTGRISGPPFFALPIRPGIAFTSLGVRIDETARVVMADGNAIRNVFAAGMIMSPNVLGAGYLAGAGITISAVFGRIAGEKAACHAIG